MAENYTIIDLCAALRVNPGAYYHWRRKPVRVINENVLLLYREAKRLFNHTRSGIGDVKLCRGLNKSGFVIGEARTKIIMRKLGLACGQRKSYKSTTNSRHSNAISPNILDQRLYLEAKNHVLSTGIMNLQTRQG